MVSNPLEDGKTFYYYDTLWRERVKPGLYEIVTVSTDKPGCVVCIRSVKRNRNGELSRSRKQDED